MKCLIAVAILSAVSEEAMVLEVDSLWDFGNQYEAQHAL
jgi:hypothetical protein